MPTGTAHDVLGLDVVRYREARHGQRAGLLEARDGPVGGSSLPACPPGRTSWACGSCAWPMAELQARHAHDADGIPFVIL